MTLQIQEDMQEMVKDKFNYFVVAKRRKQRW